MVSPGPSGPPSVVGDGTRESCSAAAIQRALDAGGWIRFDCGAGVVSVALESPLRISRSDTLLEGEGNGLILNGGERTPIFAIEPGVERVVLRDLSISNGSAPSGGVVTVPGGAILWLDNTAMLGNQSSARTPLGASPAAGGGAIQVEAGASLVVVGSSFSRNVASFGGAVWSRGRVALHGVNARQNEALDGLGRGGAVAADAGQMVVCGGDFRGNKATQGGAIYTQVATLEIEGVRFEANEARNGDGRAQFAGGALAMRDSDAGIHRSSFVANETRGAGGAVFASGGASLFENVSFEDNRISGGIPRGANTLALRGGTHRLVHATLVNNRNGDRAIEAEEGVEIRNSLLAPYLRQPLCERTLAGSGVVQVARDATALPCVEGARIVEEMTFVDRACEGSGEQRVRAPEADGALSDAADPLFCLERDQCGAARNTQACDVGAVELGD